jgi:hypothetical protein
LLSVKRFRPIVFNRKKVTLKGKVNYSFAAASRAHEKTDL